MFISNILDINERGESIFRQFEIINVSVFDIKSLAGGLW